MVSQAWSLKRAPERAGDLVELLEREVALGPAEEPTMPATVVAAASLHSLHSEPQSRPSELSPASGGPLHAIPHAPPSASRGKREQPGWGRGQRIVATLRALRSARDDATAGHFYRLQRAAAL